MGLVGKQDPAWRKVKAFGTTVAFRSRGVGEKGRIVEFYQRTIKSFNTKISRLMKEFSVEEEFLPSVVLTDVLEGILKIEERGIAVK